MKLFVNSDTAYLVLPKAKSRIARYHYLSSTLPQNNKPILNTLILVIYKILYYIVSSVVEAEIAGVFINAQIALPIRYILECLSYPQPLIPIKSDNSATIGFVSNNIHQKYSNS